MAREKPALFTTSESADLARVPPVAERLSQGRNAYVADFSANTVSVIDTFSKTLVATVPVGVGPFDVAITSV